MNLKRMYIEVNHDGPTFTDKNDDLDMSVFDVEIELNKNICKDTKGDRYQVIPVYIDLDEFPNRNKVK